MRHTTSKDITNDMELQKHYIILRGTSIDVLMLEVNLAISRGWEPLGGVSCMAAGSAWWAQAMVAKNPMRGDTPDQFFYEQWELDNIKQDLPGY